MYLSCWPPLLAAVPATDFPEFRVPNTANTYTQPVLDLVKKNIYDF